MQGGEYAMNFLMKNLNANWGQLIVVNADKKNLNIISLYKNDQRIRTNCKKGRN